MQFLLFVLAIFIVVAVVAIAWSIGKRTGDGITADGIEQGFKALCEKLAVMGGAVADRVRTEPDDQKRARLKKELSKLSK